MKMFYGVLLLASILSNQSFCEVKPEGTLLEDFCGENDAARSGEARISKVCLATVKGLSTEFVVFYYEDLPKDSKVIHPLALPILKRLPAPPTQPGTVAPGFAAEDLYLGSNESYEDKDGYRKYLVSNARLESTFHPAAAVSDPPLTPKSIKGTDVYGFAFESKKLEPIFHTESLTE